MKIVLIRCPWVTIQQPPDIGLAYLVASLKRDGHEVSLFDLNIEFYHKIEEVDKKNLIYSNPHLLIEEGKKIFHKYPLLVDESIKRILKLEPEIVGFNIWLMNGEVSKEFAKRIKAINQYIYIIFGGPDAYPLWSGKEYIKENMVDLIVYGEAEITFRKILDNFNKYRNVYPIPGTIIKDNGKEIDSGFGEVAENLDELPLPAVEVFPLELYINKHIPISFTRGCLYKCEYCPREMYPKFRWRSPKNIIEEVEFRLQTFPQRKDFFVCDAAVNANLKQIKELCDLIINRNLKVSFGGFAFTHPGMSYDSLLKMKKAGFRELCYGVESGSEKILERLGKKIKIEIIERIIKDTYNAGIDIAIDILVGLPGENENDFKQTLDFLLRCRKFIKQVGIGFFGILPYSYIYDNREKFEFIPGEVILRRINELTETIKSLNISETVESGFNIKQHK